MMLGRGLSEVQELFKKYGGEVDFSLNLQIMGFIWTRPPIWGN